MNEKTYKEKCDYIKENFKIGDRYHYMGNCVYIYDIEFGHIIFGIEEDSNLGVTIRWWNSHNNLKTEFVNFDNLFMLRKV
jgi:hypothetical protein